ncbi:hypothetical protein AB1N83_008023 [Pleurotus pulmonarius]
MAMLLGILILDALKPSSASLSGYSLKSRGPLGDYLKPGSLDGQPFPATFLRRFLGASVDPQRLRVSRSSVMKPTCGVC